MFLTIDEIRGQISASISIYSQPPGDYENMDKLHAMLIKSTKDIEKAIKAKDEERLSVLLEMIKYQIGRIDKLKEDKKYKRYKTRFHK